MRAPMNMSSQIHGPLQWADPAHRERWNLDVHPFGSVTCSDPQNELEVMVRQLWDLLPALSVFAFTFLQPQDQQW